MENHFFSDGFLSRLHREQLGLKSCFQPLERFLVSETERSTGPIPESVRYAAHFTWALKRGHWFIRSNHSDCMCKNVSAAFQKLYLCCFCSFLSLSSSFCTSLSCTPCFYLLSGHLSRESFSLLHSHLLFFLTLYWASLSAHNLHTLSQPHVE